MILSTDRRMDRRTDGQTDRVKPVYKDRRTDGQGDTSIPPFNFVEAGGIITYPCPTIWGTMPIQPRQIVIFLGPMEVMFLAHVTQEPAGRPNNILI